METIDRPIDGLGASDAAAILGVSRFSTALDVFNDKVHPQPHEGYEEHQEWGLLLEPALAARYTRDTGRRLRRVGLVRSKVHPLLYSHPDRLVVGEPGLVELKISERSWDEGIPIYYKTQGIQQMITADREWVDFAVLERGRKFAIYRLDRNRKIEPAFIAELEEWWNRHVLTGEPPGMDGGDGGRRYLSTIVPKGTEIMATPEMAAKVDLFRMAKTNRVQSEAREKVLRQEIEQMMDGADRLLGPFGKVSLVRYPPKEEISWKTYAEALEEVVRNPGSAPQGIPIDEALYTLRGLYTSSRPGQVHMRTDWKKQEDE